MTFYELLEKKASDPATRDKIVYVENRKENFLERRYAEYSYADLYAMVNDYIQNRIKNVNLITMTGKKVYIVVDNSVKSIVAIIALLKCGYQPILFDYKNIAAINEAEKNRSEMITYPDVYPYLDRNIHDFRDLYNSLDDNNPEALKDALKMVRRFKLTRKTTPIDEYIGDIYEISKPLIETEQSIVICSSGSEGKVPHFNQLSVNKLINSNHRYGEKESTFLSYITCANISGVLTNLVNPLVNDTRVILADEFDINLLSTDLSGKLALENPIERKEYPLSYRNSDFIQFLTQGILKPFSGSKLVTEVTSDKLIVKVIGSRSDKYKENYISHGIIPDSVMLPRDIFSYLENLEISDFDLSNLKHIYLAGGNNTYDTVAEMRRRFPSIRPNVFENLYGATEAYGAMTSCQEKNLKTCYINVSSYNGNLSNVIYTYDRDKYYRFLNGKEIELDKSGFVFSEIINSNLGDFFFQPYLPVSECRLDYLTADSDLSLHFENNGEQILSDAGIYIGDQLYILSRVGELVKPKVPMNPKAQTYYLSHLEAYFRKVVGTEVYCVNLDDGSVQPYLNIKNRTFNELLDLYTKCLECKQKVDGELNMIKVNYPIFLSKENFPVSEVFGKVLKGKLKEFAEYAAIQKANLEDIDGSIRKIATYAIEHIFGPLAQCSDIDSEYRFTVKLKSDSFFFPMSQEFGKLFNIIKIDDENGEMTLKVNPNILFLTFKEIINITFYATISTVLAKEQLARYLSGRLGHHVQLHNFPTPEDVGETKKFYLEKLGKFKNS